MRALILSAGLGSRLAPLTDDSPKSLVAVNGKPILFRQIESLLANDIRDITIVSGYCAEKLEREVHSRWPWISLVESKEYRETNNMYSAYLGIASMGTDADCLMMNADVFFDVSVLTALLEFPAPNAVVVDKGRYLEESMKVVEREGRLTEISKRISREEALGCSIDLYRFSAEALEIFYQTCREYIQGRGERTLWSEVALNAIFPRISFQACPLNGRWLEIDTLDDLAEAETLFAES